MRTLSVTARSLYHIHRMSRVSTRTTNKTSFRILQDLYKVYGLSCTELPGSTQYDKLTGVGKLSTIRINNVLCPAMCIVGVVWDGARSFRYDHGGYLYRKPGTREIALYYDFVHAYELPDTTANEFFDGLLASPYTFPVREFTGTWAELPLFQTLATHVETNLCSHPIELPFQLYVASTSGA